MGWKGSTRPSATRRAPMFVFELGPSGGGTTGTEYPIIDDKEDPLAARIDDLKPATTYLAILKMTPRTRRRWSARAAGEERHSLLASGRRRREFTDKVRIFPYAARRAGTAATT